LLVVVVVAAAVRTPALFLLRAAAVAAADAAAAAAAAAADAAAAGHDAPVGGRRAGPPVDGVQSVFVNSSVEKLAETLWTSDRVPHLNGGYNFGQRQNAPKSTPLRNEIFGHETSSTPPCQGQSAVVQDRLRSLLRPWSRDKKNLSTRSNPHRQKTRST